MKKVLGILTLTSLSVFAGQGGMGSGGGGAVVCRDDAGKILSAEVLDLYEGKETYHLKIKEEIGSLEQEYLRFNRTMNIVSGFGMPPAQSVLDNVKKTMDKFNYLPVDLRLELTNDFGALDFTLKPNCKIEQLAIYHDDKERIDIDSEIWDTLDNTNKAALLAHELIYKSYRNTDEDNSKLTRKVVAMLFSTTPPKSQLSDMPKDETYMCFGHNSHSQIRYDEDHNASSIQENDLIFIYPSPNKPGHTKIRLHSFVNRAIYGRTEIEVPGTININMLSEDSWNLGQGIKPSLTVMDPEANINKVVSVESELFGNDKVIVNYKFGQRFSLSLLKNGEKVYDKSFISRCYPHSSLLNE